MERSTRTERPPLPALRAPQAPSTRRPVAASVVRDVASDPGMRRGFRTPVRGHAFAARPPGTPVPAGPVRLVREPRNPVDPLAVAVWVEGPSPWRIGYLDRVVAARVAGRLDAGEPLAARVVGSVTAAGGWDRPLLAVCSDDRPPPSGGGPRPQVRPGTRPGRTPGGVWGRPPGVTRRVRPSA